MCSDEKERKSCVNHLGPLLDLNALLLYAPTIVHFSAGNRDLIHKRRPRKSCRPHRTCKMSVTVVRNREGRAYAKAKDAGIPITGILMTDLSRKYVRCSLTEHESGTY